MAIFNKIDPAEKAQRDLDIKVKAARTSRDDLVQRRKVAEAAAAKHRQDAVKLASGGGDDTALSAAEGKMRREQDRVATLNDAIAKVEITIADLDREIAQVVDQRCRAETAAAVNAIVEKWASAGAAFDAAVAQLADLARESAVIVPDAAPLRQFAEALQQQVPPEIEHVASVLRGHAKSVLAGTASPTLPKAPEPAPVVVTTPAPEVRRVFALRPIKWKDAAGRQQYGQQFEDCELPHATAEKALRCGAVTRLDDDRRKMLKGARGGQHVNQNAIDLLDLDALEGWSGARHASFDDPVLRAANFTPIDRSADARVIAIPAQRAG